MTERDGRHVVRAHSVNQPSDRPPRTFEAGRVCRDEACITVLSVYNKGPFCTIHTPFQSWKGIPAGRPKKAVA